ncbi:MAG: VWA domain-containing protein, partial [Chloroflexi bacterium]|nr:VWA domain-containing protein [Chloroflexota bacterium]
LQPDDFEVFRTEHRTEVSTVLMIDLSRSMLYSGCYVAAKRVVLALNALIQMQYPRDSLYIVGFADRARQLQPEDLSSIDWSEERFGTNLQHGLMLARRLLSRHTAGTRQVIVITDGEPTAHVEADGQVMFHYPPTWRTYEETIREVVRCTRDRVIINTFMLERGRYLTEFIEQITRINRGRAFFATPERLGEYILVDYVRNKRKRVS